MGKVRNISKRVRTRQGIILAVAVFVCLLSKYILPVVIPLGAAVCVSRFGIVCAERLKIKKAWQKKAFSIFAVLVIYLSAVAFVAILWRGIYYQTSAICAEILSYTDKISVLKKIIDEKIFRISASIADTLYFAVKNAAVSLAAKLPALVAHIASAVPKMVLAVVVTVLASIYLCIDGDFVFSFIKKRIPSGARLIYATAGAYGILFLLTFAELFLGFSIAGVRFSAFAALAVAFVDILPVLGTGAVLLPWAAVRLLLGDGGFALTLFVLWAVITVVRQIAEPRLVGDRLGIPPVLSIAAMYAGYCLFGAPGAIILPIAAAFCFACAKAEKSDAPA